MAKILDLTQTIENNSEIQILKKDSDDALEYYTS